MENFQFCISTNVLFGKDQIENLPNIVSGYGKRVLLVYGGAVSNEQEYMKQSNPCLPNMKFMN